MALAFGLSLIAAAHHRAAVAHGYCSEHGKQVHLGHDEGHHHSNEHGGGPLDQPSVEGDHHVAGAHDCAHLAFLAQPCSLRRAKLDHGNWRHTSREPARRATPPVAGIPLLHLSPKNSPPA
jgi:hypothetical protein